MHLVNNLDTAMDLFHWLGTEDAQGVIAVDSETTGLDKEKDVVRLVQVGGREHGWSIPWEGWHGVFADIVKRFDGIFALHNAPYDVCMLDRMGVKLPRDRVRDTRVMAHVLESTYSTALKNQSARYIDPRAGSAQKELDEALGRKGGWTWATIPIEFQPYWAYAAVDTILTRHLYDHHYPAVMADAPYAFEIESGVQWVIENMERRGVHVDVGHAQETMISYDKYCDEVEKWVKESYGVSPGSNAKIIEILHAAGVEFTKKTDSGAFSLDKEVLESIDHPLAKAVFTRRQLQKISSTYLSHFVMEADENFLLHPSINALGARTSRMSMSGPNFQNLLRIGTSKAGDEVRNSVTTRYGEDGMLIFCDFDQVEMRILAHMSNEERMIEAFKSEDDFFVTLARDIFNNPTITKKDKVRQIVKNAGYATIYGAGTAKFAMTAGISEYEASSFMRRWNNLYPAVKQHAQATHYEAMRNRTETGVPFVRCPITGRKQIADVGKEYALVNYKIQGAAASILKIKLNEMDAAGLGEFMILPVHDEIILDVPNERVKEVVQSLHDIMNDDKLLNVPITASVAHGKRWGQKKDWEWN